MGLMVKRKTSTLIDADLLDVFLCGLGVLAERIDACLQKGERTAKIAAYGTKSDVVLDPFGGSGTTAVAARETGRKAILVELNPEYCEKSKERIKHANQKTLWV